MAHELSFTDGKADMLYVGRKPWHGLGTEFAIAPSLDEAIVGAGLDWSVTTEQVFTGTGEVLNALATRRISDNKILGVVGPTYTPLQNRDAFKFFEPFIDSKEATIETAGSLREGNRVWIQAKISRDPMIIKGNDTVEKFLLLSNSHDGTLAVRVSLVGRRVVCANTLAMAHGEKSAKFIRIRHAKNVKDTLMGVQSIVNLVNNEFEATAEQYRRLANTQINSSDLEKYIKIVFDQSIKSKGVDFSTVGTVGGKILISQIIPLFEGGRGNNLPEIRNTWWSAYNAVNEHIGYNRGQNAEARLDSLWFGAGATLNKKALDVALQMAVA